MFLPDRFIKGECPKCHALDQYGDNCEVCGAVYAPTDLINPFSALSGATPELKKLGALFLQTVRPALRGFLEAVDARRQVAARGGQQDQGMVLGAHQPGRQHQRRPGRLGHLARRALLWHRDSRCAGQVFLCVAGRTHWLPGLAEKPAGQKRDQSYEAYMANPALEQYHFIGKDIVTFHTLFWPATLHFSGRKTPTTCLCTAF
jgi:methionyl-tRNA synthetase